MPQAACQCLLMHVVFSQADRPLPTHRGHIARLNRYGLAVNGLSTFGRKMEREESAQLPHQSIGGQLTQAKRCKAGLFGEVDAA